MAALKSILLVDDDAVTNLLHQRKISKLGLAQTVFVATDGQAALEHLVDCIAENRPVPELVLLDINMPRMNGFEFLEAYEQLSGDIRQGQQIVMVSTSTLRRDKARADQDESITTFLVKPLSDQDFRDIVNGC
ncbi:MAG: response regulator [Roseobacter sp.]